MTWRLPTIITFSCVAIFLGSCTACFCQDPDPTAGEDEIRFVGLIGWAKHPDEEAYWAFLPDADCDDPNNDPSPPGKEFCSDDTLRYQMEHEPYLLFHNAKFKELKLPITSQGIYVNLSGRPDDPGTSLSGIPLKGTKIDFDLEPSELKTSNLETLVSADDVPKSGWELVINEDLFGLNPNDSDTDVLQAKIIADSGLLEAAGPTPLDCEEQPQDTLTYGLASEEYACDTSTPRPYAEDVILSTTNKRIHFTLERDEKYEFTVERLDPDQPMKLYILNVHPRSWRSLLDPKTRSCDSHHDAFLWFYQLAKKPHPGAPHDHFHTCDKGTFNGADRRCPQILYN